MRPPGSRSHSRAACSWRDETDQELIRLSATDLIAGYAARSLSPVELVAALADRVRDVEPDLKAFVALSLEGARAEAVKAERAWARGGARPLEGVPFAAKDVFDTAGVPTAYGSPMFAGHVPAADAEAVARARSAGAILLGKTSTHEFAWGITGYNRHFDSGRNPWSPDRVSGGSSGGSAAALAAHEVPLALGTDTAGSIRIPAAFCGVVGHKPSFGRVAAGGVFPLSPSLDHVGPLARTPADAALFLSVLAGRELAPLPRTLAGVRVAICADLMPVTLADDVDEVFAAALGALESLGASLVEARLPEAARVADAFSGIQRTEALRVHRRAGLWPPRRQEYGPDVRARLELAGQGDLDGYLDAVLAREQIRAGFVRLFDGAELLVTPVAAVSPVLRGSDDLEHLGKRVTFREVVLPFTMPQCLAGLPACTVRAGFDRLGLPVGIQLTGPLGSDRAVLGAAERLFEATPAIQRRWPDPHPPRRAPGE